MMFVKEFNYCRLSTKNTFLNSLRFLCSIYVLQATTPLYTEAHERLTALLTNFTSLILQNTQCFRCKHRWTSGHFFKNHSLNKRFVALLPSTVFLHSPYLVWNSSSADREMSSCRQEWTISTQLQSHVWAMSNFPNIKGRRESAIHTLTS